MKDYAFLLNRAEYEFQEHDIDREVKGRRILVTGAGGTIGSAIVRRLLQGQPEKVILVGHSELPIFNLLRTLPPHSPVEVATLDVGNKVAMRLIIDQWKPDTIFHAAAHKHVGLMQDQPSAAFQNNTVATIKLAQVALESRSVRRFVFISTDKAVNPTSTMGASKRLAEVALRTHFSPFTTTCRFGNVLGSSGSLVEIVERQIKEGKTITLTDPDMMRFFITAREAVGLVTTAAFLEEGDCFSIDMGKPQFVAGVIERLTRESNYRNIKVGLPGSGEKMEEEILGPNEEFGVRPHNIALLRIETKSNPAVDEALLRVSINPRSIIREAHAL